MSASPDRRTVLRGAALTGIACFGAAACAAGEQGAHTRPSSDAPVELGPATEVPVGGAKLYAAQRLTFALRNLGVTVASSARTSVTPTGARELAHVDSPPMATLARLTKKD